MRPMKPLPLSSFALAAAAVLATAAAAPSQAQTIQVNKENRTIAITTSDQAEAIADVAVVSVGFSTYGTDQDSTYAEGSRISNAIMKALQDSGVKSNSIESANQSLNAIEDSDKPRYTKGLRFAFSQSWRVTVAAKDAADILHVAITAGANDSGGIQWKLANDDALEAEAAEKALAHAQQIASRMAKGLNAKLGPLVYASNQTPPRTLFGGAMLQTESASMASSKINLKPIAISPEKIEKSATVYAIFAIE
jgi:uncharacterized protein YggE